MSSLHWHATPPDLLVLPPEDQPLVDDMLAKVEPWIMHHLQETLKFTSDADYEISLHGCINTLLTSIFPARRHYISHPQAILGGGIGGGKFDDDPHSTGDTSVGSSGGVHDSESRYLASQESKKIVVDFLVAKDNLQASPPLNRTIVCVIDVMRKTGTIAEARWLILQSMNHLAQHPLLRIPDMYGYLVLGDSFEIYRICDEDKRVTNEGTFHIFGDDGRTFTRALADISSKNWNR